MISNFLWISVFLRFKGYSVFQYNPFFLHHIWLSFFPITLFQKVRLNFHTQYSSIVSFYNAFSSVSVYKKSYRNALFVFAEISLQRRVLSAFLQKVVWKENKCRSLGHSLDSQAINQGRLVSLGPSVCSCNPSESNDQDVWWRHQRCTRISDWTRWLRWNIVQIFSCIKADFLLS